MYVMKKSGKAIAIRLAQDGYDVCINGESAIEIYNTTMTNMN